jgi:peptide methionine sulfoxide reductase msrA/msrB
MSPVRLLVVLSSVALVVLATIAAWSTENKQPKGDAHMSLRDLTPEEKQVIIHKGTEPPFSGKYLAHKADGTYQCRQCGAPLFASGAKFDSGCGWPAFDDALPGAVRELPDPDGARTEIVCAKCSAHLGHVFRGEGFTPTDTRHCVNSVSLEFAPKSSDTEVAYFAGGCFWGVEYHFERTPGVISADSGYMGGKVQQPTYKQVCTGSTGHAEAVRVTFDPKVVSFETLAKLFFEIHDPTQEDRQGPDVGEQYRSAVFFVNDEQKRIAADLIKQLMSQGLYVVTELNPAGTFWPAEEYHQDYYTKTGKEPYCHSRVKRF